jgi:hypothetical protein
MSVAGYLGSCSSPSLHESPHRADQAHESVKRLETHFYSACNRPSKLYLFGMQLTEDPGSGDSSKNGARRWRKDL